MQPAGVILWRAVLLWGYEDDRGYTNTAIIAGTGTPGRGTARTGADTARVAGIGAYGRGTKGWTNS